jgi:hypothetical protein
MDVTALRCEEDHEATQLLHEYDTVIAEPRHGPGSFEWQGGVKVLTDCKECDRLLEAYTRKTREYLCLIRLRSALFQDLGQAALQEFDSRFQADSEHRAFAKRDLLQHDRVHRA